MKRNSGSNSWWPNELVSFRMKHFHLLLTYLPKQNVLPPYARHTFLFYRCRCSSSFSGFRISYYQSLSTRCNLPTNNQGCAFLTLQIKFVKRRLVYFWVMDIRRSWSWIAFFLIRWLIRTTVWRSQQHLAGAHKYARRISRLI